MVAADSVFVSFELIESTKQRRTANEETVEVAAVPWWGNGRRETVSEGVFVASEAVSARGFVGSEADLATQPTDRKISKVLESWVWSLQILFSFRSNYRGRQTTRKQQKEKHERKREDSRK